MATTAHFYPQQTLISIPVPQYPRLSLTAHRLSVLHGACHSEEGLADPDLMTRTLQAHRSATAHSAIPRLATARSNSHPDSAMSTPIKSTGGSAGRRGRSSASEGSKKKGTKQWRSGFVNPLDENGKKRKGRPPRAAYHAAGMLDSYDHRRVQVTEQAKKTRVFIDDTDRRSRNKTSDKLSPANVAHRRFREWTVASSIEDFNCGNSSIGGSPAAAWSSPESTAPSSSVRGIRRAAVESSLALQMMREQSDEVGSMMSLESSPLQHPTVPDTKHESDLSFSDFQLDGHATLGPAFVEDYPTNYGLAADVHIAQERSRFPTLEGLDTYSSTAQPAPPAAAPAPEPSVNLSDIFTQSELLNANLCDPSMASLIQYPLEFGPQQPASQRDLITAHWDGYTLTDPELHLPSPPEGTVNLFQVSRSAELGRLGYHNWGDVVGKMPWLHGRGKEGFSPAQHATALAYAAAAASSN